jgi:membrane fusion protein (multidrug efflux system)
MNPIVFVRRRPVTTLILLVAIVSGGGVGLVKAGVDVFGPRYTPKVNAYLDDFGKRAIQLKGYIAKKLESSHEEEAHHEPHKIVVTSPNKRDVPITQEYVCQIHSQRHIKVRALEKGYINEINIKEGQAVKKDYEMFKVIPILYKTNFDAAAAEAKVAKLELEYTKKLFKDKVVSENDVNLHAAKWAKAEAQAQQAKAEFDFTIVKAPFDGIVDTLHEQLGSLVEEGDILTTLSDNSLMWVYFNVPEARYLEYMADRAKHKADERIELKLADGNIFTQAATNLVIEAKFNNETGNIPFRADFPNPDRLLRHGQTGTVMIRRELQNALVIPQRSTFEILDKRYVYVVDDEDVVHQREIVVQNELEDIFVVKKGVALGDRVVLEGMRQIRDGEKVTYEFRKPEIVMAKLKNKAE